MSSPTSDTVSEDATEQQNGEFTGCPDEDEQSEYRAGASSKRERLINLLFSHPKRKGAFISVILVFCILTVSFVVWNIWVAPAVSALANNSNWQWNRAALVPTLNFFGAGLVAFGGLAQWIGNFKKVRQAIDENENGRGDVLYSFARTGGFLVMVGGSLVALSALLVLLP